MTGNKSGVAAQLAMKYPNIMTWHCWNHHLELAVGDASCCGSNQNKSFLIFQGSTALIIADHQKHTEGCKQKHCSLTFNSRKDIGRLLNTRLVAVLSEM